MAGTLKLTVSETVERRVWYDDREPVPFWQPRRWRPWRPWPPRPVETTRDRNPEYYPIPADGLVTFDIPTSDRVKQLSLKVREFNPSDFTLLYPNANIIIVSIGECNSKVRRP